MITGIFHKKYYFETLSVAKQPKYYNVTYYKVY